eukprot:gb/GECG01015853.1/.p1 GENE.gb/GECG01015853.1/~~gb/GECG01015853.1/.p1  ORF type:complete len:254 (+),score=34.02 gb/GECG01015853.1/:1-762(+)
MASTMAAGTKREDIVQDITGALTHDEIRQLVQKVLKPAREDESLPEHQKVPLLLKAIRGYKTAANGKEGMSPLQSIQAILNQIVAEKSIEETQKAAAIRGTLVVLQRLAYNDANANTGKEVCSEIGLPQSYSEAIVAEWVEHRSSVMKTLRDMESTLSEDTTSTPGTSHVQLDLQSLFSQQSRQDCLESLFTVSDADGQVSYSPTSTRFGSDVLPREVTKFRLSQDQQLVLKERDLQHLLAVFDDVQSQLDVL